jgi:hypothetical protein
MITSITSMKALRIAMRQKSSTVLFTHRVIGHKTKDVALAPVIVESIMTISPIEKPGSSRLPGKSAFPIPNSHDRLLEPIRQSIAPLRVLSPPEFGILGRVHSKFHSG